MKKGEPDGNPAGSSGKPSGKKGEDALLMAMATGASVPAAAKAAGIGVSTAYRHLDQPEFRKRVSEVRQWLLNEAVGKLMAAAVKAVGTLERHMDSPNEAVAGRAALGILSHMLRGVEVVELEHRIAALEGGGKGVTR